MAVRLKYFAYASNLFKQRVFHTIGQSSGASVIGSAKLKDYELCFGYESAEWKGCKATALSAPGKIIWGLLWNVSEDDRAKLAWAEEVHLGKFREIQIDVSTPDGATHGCFAYEPTTIQEPDGLPSPQYKDIIIRGAIQAGLPEDYIQTLRQKPDNGYVGELKIYDEILSSINP